MNLLRTTMAASLLLTVSGCVQYATLIELNKDGTGQLHVRLLFSEELKKEGGGFISISSGNSESQDSLESRLKTAEQKFQDLTAELGDGVKFVKTKRITSKKGWIGLQATYSFTDINTLRVPNTIPDFDSEDEPDETESALECKRAPYIFSYRPGKTNQLEVRLDPKPTVPVDEEKDPFGEAGLTVPEAASAGATFSNAFAIPILKPIVQDVRFSTMLKVSGDISETNAPEQTNDQSVFLSDFRVGVFARTDTFDKAIIEKWEYERLVKEGVDGLTTHAADEVVSISFK